MTSAISPESARDIIEKSKTYLAKISSKNEKCNEILNVLKALHENSPLQPNVVVVDSSGAFSILEFTQTVIVLHNTGGINLIQELDNWVNAEHMNMEHCNIVNMAFSKLATASVNPMIFMDVESFGTLKCSDCPYADAAETGHYSRYCYDSLVHPVNRSNNVNDVLGL
jgi:uncharacterized membrane protein